FIEMPLRSRSSRSRRTKCAETASLNWVFTCPHRYHKKGLTIHVPVGTCSSRMFTRILSRAADNLCSGGRSFPAILELVSGDIAVIGADITEQAMSRLLPGTGCGHGERVVSIPRSVLLGAQSSLLS